MMMLAEGETPFPRVLHRPNLFMRAEREYVLCLLLLSSELFYAGLSILTTIIAIAFWAVGHAALVWIADNDPQGIRIYRQSLKFEAHYEPRSTPFRRG
jgi:type IV secretory pathway TrbD component